MVEFGNKPIPVAPAPERAPEPSEDTTFGGEPELSETHVIDGEQATAPPEIPWNGCSFIPPRRPSVDKPPETAPKVTSPDKVTEKPKPKKKKGKHNKKKRRHGR